MVNTWLFEALLDFLFPAECTFCQNFLGEGRFVSFCKSCWGKIKFIQGSLCTCCGRPFESENVLETAPGFLCGSCRNDLYYFDKARAVGKYEGVLKEAIHQFKYKPTRIGMGKPSLGRHLAELMIHHGTPSLNVGSFDAIMPIPLHKSRQRHRGFNQSEVLARFLGHYYRIPLDVDHLYRVKETRPQTGLSGHERAENVKGAFVIRKAEELKGKKIVLIDDVFTTGATVNEASRVLKEAKAGEVLVLTLAKVC